MSVLSGCGAAAVDVAGLVGGTMGDGIGLQVISSPGVHGIPRV